MRFTLARKLGLGFGSLLLILAIMGFVAFNSISQLQQVSKRVVAMMSKKDMASQLGAEIEQQTTGVRGFLLVGREDVLKIDTHGEHDFNENMDRLKRTIYTDEGKKLHAEIRASFDAYRAILDHEIELRRSDKTKEAVDLAFNADTGEKRSRLRRTVADLNVLEDKLKDDLLAEQVTTESRLRATVWMVAATGMAIGVGVAAFLILSITSAVAGMLALTQAVAARNLTFADMKITSDDEIGRAGIALNKMKNGLHEVIHAIAGSAQHVAAASEALSGTSEQITANSGETSAQAKVVSAATSQVTQNLQTVATGAEQMGSSIREIAKNASECAAVATSAVKIAESTTTTVSKLGESSTEIGQVIKVITSIAQQTNLLALNATIEAARAGEAGKGFAVVANEVKELAKETAKATEDISRKIEAIQTDTKAAVEAIASISDVINRVNGISNTIATAVEEQNATTNEMVRNVSEAAKGSGEITFNISGVSQAAESTSRGAGETQKAALQLVETSAELRRLVEQFKIDPGGRSHDDSTASTAFRKMAAHAS
jgi:methyl-accepting chemotaxis protein